jgi:hypothetical protein
MNGKRANSEQWGLETLADILQMDLKVASNGKSLQGKKTRTSIFLEGLPITWDTRIVQSHVYPTLVGVLVKFSFGPLHLLVLVDFDPDKRAQVVLLDGHKLPHEEGAMNTVLPLFKAVWNRDDFLEAIEPAVMMAYEKDDIGAWVKCSSILPAGPKSNLQLQ